LHGAEGGGGLISQQAEIRVPDPLPFRDFFLAQQDFRHDALRASGVAKLVAEQNDCIIQRLAVSESQVEQMHRACRSFLDDLFSHCIQPRIGGV
jgi:hypothetical protein